jgi:uncharacterized protein
MAAINSLGNERLGRSERIDSLDIIRGVAILFILCMNVTWMMLYAPEIRDPRIPAWTALDQGAFTFVLTFLEGTQRGLLELLFGAGMMIMARKAMVPDGPVSVADLHYRRNLLLIAFGLFNALILLWPGDILFLYGLAALFIFPARLLRPRGQILIGILLLLAVPTGFSIRDYIERSDLQQTAARAEAAAATGKPLTPEMKEARAEWNKVVAKTKPIAQNPEKKKNVEKISQQRHGPLLTYAAGQWAAWAHLFEMLPIFLSIMSEIIATMLIGAALFQLGIIQGKASSRTYWMMLIGGYAVGLSLRYWGVLEILQFTATPKLFWLYSDFARLAVVLGHLAGIHLLLRSSIGRAALKPFQAAGRMPLTTYLFTSLLMCWLIVPGIGLGLHGTMGWFGIQMLALSVIAFEVIATNVFMRYHETGPMEWLWKSLAYGKRQPYRRVGGPAPALAPAQ